ncbi:lysozyme-like [Ostrinia nubilalis]|uniref:lysozyme-like n=1 Tax=Ostrinia nubilalis TaxID=29057 RepID=UPI0030826200
MRVLYLIVFIVFCLSSVCGVYITNLSGACLRCLCHVAGCDMSHGCTDGYCGPFYISRVYWVDAGRPTLPEDNPDRVEAFEDCAKDYYCSIKIVENYMARFGKDCNKDGVTDCFDYMMINYHGGRACTGPLFLTMHGLRWLNKYKQCKL